MSLFRIFCWCLIASSLPFLPHPATAATVYSSIYGYNGGVNYNWYNNYITTGHGTHVNASGETGSGTAFTQVDRGNGTIVNSTSGYIFNDYCINAGASCNTGGGGMIAMVETFDISGTGDLTFFMDISGTSHGDQGSNGGHGTMSMYATDARSQGTDQRRMTGARKAAPEVGPNAFTYDRIAIHLNVFPFDTVSLPYIFTIRWMQSADTFVSASALGGTASASQTMRAQIGVEVTSGVTITSASGFFPITTLPPVVPNTIAVVPLPASGAVLLLGLSLLGGTRKRVNG